MVHDVRGHYYLIIWERRPNGLVRYDNFGLPQDKSDALIYRYKQWEKKRVVEMETMHEVWDYNV